MSFKDELVKKVNSARDLIRQNAINNFVGILKSSMIKCAEEGKISGSINLDIETDWIDAGSYSNMDVYSQLEKLYEEERLVDIDDIRRYAYKWLMEEVKKTNIFADIEMKLHSDDNILEFHWYL